MRRDSFAASVLSREIEDQAVRSKSYRRLYSARRWISDLDIVNELAGHSGCVNALCWSKSGGLLASGSDDRHLNIHTYNPASSTNQFQLSATVATGHTQNIFSVKFMPHSNDRIVVTASGDAQVRIFDLEYAGHTSTASTAATLASEGRRRARSNVYSGVRNLSDGDTNARVYKSHDNRVKRIVTESSPHLFLTCSEDGEVRQWDLREPSSTYPESRSSRYSSDASVPPPLISYKRYGLDLNTISCSSSQPHYILLGGTHLHAFLHDRRVTGRDRLAEMGRPLSPMSSLSADDQELLHQATQCVRKFAPQGQQRMRRADNGHITACKISDARPDEAVVSWSGDHIYSFDLHRDPIDDSQEDVVNPLRSKRKESQDRKRKRKGNGSEISLAQDARASSRPRTERERDQDSALRIRYQNGQSEDIPLPSHTQILTERQRDARRIAKATVKIRSSLFGARIEGSTPVTQFTSALGHAASIIADMDEAMREWGYPMSPDAEDVAVQQYLRKGRERSRRFVQTAGTLARILGGRLQTPSGASPMMAHFSVVEARVSDLELPRQEQFYYDFSKAILLWLDSGVGRLIEGFSRPRDMALGARGARRLPIPEADQAMEAIDDILIPYLLDLAGDDRVINGEANRFETEESREVFPTEKAAVLTFARAIQLPFADLSSATSVMEGTSGEPVTTQNRQAALRFWGAKVGRGLLWKAGQGVNYSAVDRCFGGLGRVMQEASAEDTLADLLADAPDQESTEALRAVDRELIDEHGNVIDGANAQDVMSAARQVQEETETHDENANDHDYDDDIDDDDSEDDDSEDDDDDFDEEDDEEFSISSSDADEEDGVPNFGIPRHIYRPAFDRRRLRPKVESEVPCTRSTRTYRGHCNVRTVKDVNFFGPDDEYVVSGSDDGNFFIWDRKTSELINVLEGDGEVRTLAWRRLRQYVEHPPPRLKLSASVQV